MVESGDGVWAREEFLRGLGTERGVTVADEQAPFDEEIRQRLWEPLHAAIRKVNTSNRGSSSRPGNATDINYSTVVVSVLGGGNSRGSPSLLGQA